MSPSCSSSSLRMMLALFFLSVFLSVCLVSSSGASKVPLRNIDSLVFSRDSKTTGRRSSPIPQMQCTGGPCHLSPASIFCKNIGLDSNDDVNWECKATLTSGVTLGKVQVSCEGYDYPEDPYILKGSCGLEYALEGGAATHNSYDSSYQSSDYYRPHYSSSSSSFMSSAVSVLAFLVIAFIIARACSSPSPHFRGGGGGSAWGPHDNPPAYGSGVYSSSTASCAAPGAAASGAQGPGFWTGIGLGGLGGYFMGRNRNGYGMRYGNGYGGYGFGGGYRAAPAYAPSGGGGSSSSSSYGGTRRR